MTRCWPILCALSCLLLSSSARADSGVPLPVALFGRLHFPLLHFPLVLLFVVLLLEVVGKSRLEASRLRAVTLPLLTLAAGSAVVTAAAGLAYATGEDFEGASWGRFVVHRATGIGVAVASVVLVVVRRRGLAAVYLPLLCASVVAVVVTGHAGGELVHGIGFFTRPLHQQDNDKGHDDKGDKGHDDKGGDDTVVSYDDGDGGGEARARQPEGAIPEKPDYTKDIAPLFERSCVKCHGPDKRKSGLRLDQKRFAMKGGESGPVAIVPGDPNKSLVYTFCDKPPGDEDLMPPKGKLLALSEIETLKRWIEQGAAWPEP